MTPLGVFFPSGFCATTRSAYLHTFPTYLPLSPLSIDMYTRPLSRSIWMYIHTHVQLQMTKSPSWHYMMIPTQKLANQLAIHNRCIDV